MRGFAKTLAALCAILFTITAIPVLLFFNIERKAFSSTTYKQAFEDQHLYERMPAILASTLQVSISQNPNAFPFLKELSHEDWQVTIATLLPPEELRLMTDGALDSTFEYVNSRSDTIVISLMPVKIHLAGPAGVKVIKQFLTTQPPCTLEQLAQMGLGLLGGDVALCNPPPEAIGLFEPLIQSQMQTITAVIPNELTLTPDPGIQNDPRPRLHLIRSAIRFSPFFVILLLLTIAVLAVRTLRDLMIWWGGPLAVTGFFSAIIALVGTPVIGLLLRFVIQSQGLIPLPPLLAPSIAETISAVTRQMLSPVIWQGLALAVLGGIMFAAGTLLGNRSTYMGDS